MQAQDPPTLDRRSRRTREAICDALLRLVMTGPYTLIRTADLIDASGVGRSTFYEHFKNKDEVLLLIITPLLSPIAEARAGCGQVQRLESILLHMWDRRSLSRILFEPAVSPKIERRLAQLIEARLGNKSTAGIPLSMLALGAAAESLTLLRMWLRGEASCSAAALAGHLLHASRRGSAPREG